MTEIDLRVVYDLFDTITNTLTDEEIKKLVQLLNNI